MSSVQEMPSSKTIYRHLTKLQQRGLAAMINATAATTTARALLGPAFDASVAASALAAVTPPFGRGEVVLVDGQPLGLVLVKNPAGFTVALSTYGSTPVATMVAINDNYADGRDVSWLYDVSFESLRERGVVVPVTYIRKGTAPGFAVLDAEGKMIAMQWHESLKKYVALDEQDSYRWSDNDGQAVLSHLEADHTAKEVTLLSACRSDDAEE